MLENNNYLFLSIIIPVYNNSRRDLKRCINCLTYTRNKLLNFEIILVDDGSEQSCSAFLDQMALEREKLFIIHQKNQGPAAARNNGVLIAKGKYVLFVDADDIIPKQFWQDIDYIYQQKYDHDIIYGLVQLKPYDYNGEEMTQLDVTNIMTIAEKKKLYRHLIDLGEGCFKFTQGYISRGPIARLVKRSLLLKCPFRVSLFHGEDDIWNLDIVISAKKIGIIPHCWYYYIENPDSITHKPSSDYIAWRKKFIEDLIPYVKSPELYIAFGNEIIEVLHEIARTLYLSDANFCNIWHKNRSFNRLKKEYPFNLINIKYTLGGKKSLIKYLMYKTNVLLLGFWLKAKI